MSAFNRFLIFRSLALSLGATMVITVTMVFSQSQRLVDAVINYGMSTGAFVQILLSLIPFMADGALVAGTAIGLTFVMLEGRRSRELLVEQTLGLSPYRRFLPFALVACCLMLLQLLLSMVIVPPSLRFHQNARNNYVQHIDVKNVLMPGFISQITPTTSIYVDERMDGNNFRGLRIYSNSTSGKELTSFANRVAFYESESKLSVVMIEGMQVFEGEKSGVPRVTTFSTLPMLFDSSGSGLLEILTPVETEDEQRSREYDLENTRGSASIASKNSMALEIGQLTPSEVPTSMAFQGVLFVFRHWREGFNFLTQSIRVPSNEFHRRIATALSIVTIVFMTFAFLTADFHLRRPPVLSYVQMAVAVMLTLLIPRFVIEMDARYFPIMYLGVVVPVLFVLARWLGISRHDGQ